MDATEAQTYAARSTVDNSGVGVAPAGGPVEAEEDRGKEAEALKAQVDGCGEAGTSASAEAAALHAPPRQCDDGSETGY